MEILFCVNSHNEAKSPQQQIKVTELTVSLVCPHIHCHLCAPIYTAICMPTVNITICVPPFNICIPKYPIYIAIHMPPINTCILVTPYTLPQPPPPPPTPNKLICPTLLIGQNKVCLSRHSVPYVSVYTLLDYCQRYNPAYIAPCYSIAGNTQKS